MSELKQPTEFQEKCLQLSELLLRPAIQQLLRDSISLASAYPERRILFLQALRAPLEPPTYPFVCAELVNCSDAEGPTRELTEVKSRRLLPQTRHSLFCVTTRYCCLIGKAHLIHKIRCFSATLLSFLIYIIQCIVCCDCCLEAQSTTRRLSHRCLFRLQNIPSHCRENSQRR